MGVPGSTPGSRPLVVMSLAMSGIHQIVGESQAFFHRHIEQLSQGDSGAEGHLVGGKIDVDNLVEELCADG